MNMPVSWPCPYCEMNTGGHAFNCPLFQQTQTIATGNIGPFKEVVFDINHQLDTLRAERDSLLVSRELYRNLAIQYEKLLLRIREWDNNGNVDGPWLTEWIDEVIGRFPKSEAE